MQPFALYLHIPFCLHKCPYCDFNTYALASIPEREYVTALLAELDYRASLPEWKGRSVKSIYFGGGTPSLFSPASIHKILTAIGATFELKRDAEISLEANPGNIALETLASYRESGVNRLSFGVQSFSAQTLRTLGRIHTPEQGESAVHTAREAGFDNVSIDLIYGVPNQSLADLRADLATAAQLSPDHLSAYGLTIEKGTPFYVSYQKGILKLPQEDAVVEMMDELNTFVPNIIGLRRYEISNFGRPGFEARHNMAYWDGDDYLGLGAGAHSYCRVEGDEATGTRNRWSNYAPPNKYMEEAVAHGSAASWSDQLSLGDAIFEFFFLGLRKIDGVSPKLFESRFGYTIAEVYPGRLDELIAQEMIASTPERLALTEKGLMVADSVIEAFLEPEGIAEGGSSGRRAGASPLRVIAG